MNFYLIQLSNKTEIEIDQEDFEKFSVHAPSGNFIKLKRGLVNPSFVVAIIPIKKEDKKKIEGEVVDGVFKVTKEEIGTHQLEDGFRVTKKVEVLN